MNEKLVDGVAWVQNLPEDLPIIHTFCSLLIDRCIKTAYCSITIMVCAKGSSSASFIHADRKHGNFYGDIQNTLRFMSVYV